MWHNTDLAPAWFPTDLNEIQLLWIILEEILFTLAAFDRLYFIWLLICRLLSLLYIIDYFSYDILITKYLSSWTRTWHSLILSLAVHLRIREVDQLVPKSLYPTTSGNTYWQVETEASLLNGKQHTLILMYFQLIGNNYYKIVTYVVIMARIISMIITTTHSLVIIIISLICDLSSFLEALQTSL